MLSKIPTISPSMRSAWRHCPRKVFFRYVAAIEPVRGKKAFAVGTAFHSRLEAWRSGCEVVEAGHIAANVYRNSMLKAGLEDDGYTSAQVFRKAADAAEAPTAEGEYPSARRRPRPAALSGITYRKETPLGTAYVTVNINGGDQPFEVFLNVGKAGSDTAAVAEALGRIMSLVLRLPSPMSPIDRLKMVVDQLAGIGGGRSLGFGPNRVRSLP